MLFINNVYQRKHRLCRSGIATLLIAVVLVTSCKKTVQRDNPATLQIFNAMDAATSLFVNLTGSHPIPYRDVLSIDNKVYASAGSFLVARNVIYIDQSNKQPLALYASTDTLAKDLPVIKVPLELEAGAIYSMFVYGGKADADYILHKDAIPAMNLKDSTMHIRIANVSTAQTISVNLKGEPVGSFVNKLNFKELSGFIEMKADKSISSYEFEIRDYQSGTIITNFIAQGVNDYTGMYGPTNNWYYKSHTLVLVGLPNGSGTDEQKVVLMNHR